MRGCSEEKEEESLVTRQPQCHLPRHAKANLVSLEAAFKKPPQQVGEPRRTEEEE